MTPQRVGSIILSILIVVGLIVITISAFDQIACEGQLINNNVSPTTDQQIQGEQRISQSFVAPHDNLNRVDILFQTYQRQNTHDVTLRLLEVPPNIANPLQGVERFKINFNAGDVSDQMWHTFFFPPIADSSGKTYLISLASPESSDGDAITVGGIERNVYERGSAFLGAVPVPADLTFRACFQMSEVEKLNQLANQLVQSRPSIWGDFLFYGAILLFYFLLMLGLFWQLYRTAYFNL